MTKEKSIYMTFYVFLIIRVTLINARWIAFLFLFLNKQQSSFLLIFQTFHMFHSSNMATIVFFDFSITFFAESKRMNSDDSMALHLLGLTFSLWYHDKVLPEWFSADFSSEYVDRNQQDYPPQYPSNQRKWHERICHKSRITYLKIFRKTFGIISSLEEFIGI